MEEAQAVLTQLFERYSKDPGLLPSEYLERFSEIGARALADYLAGMTDRYAIKDAQRLGIKVDRLA